MQRSTYAVAGVQAQPGMRMNVRSHVFVPDAEAGDRDQRQQFFSGNETVRVSRQPVMLRKSFAVLLIAAALLFVVLSVVSRVVSLNNLRRTLDAESKLIQNTESEMHALNEQLAEAQDAMRIAYMAEQQFNMVFVNRSDAVPVTAPETRYDRNNTYLSGSREGSPLSPDHGMISGSR